MLNMLRRLDKIRFRGHKREDFLDLAESPNASDTECGDELPLKIPRTSPRDSEELRDPVSTPPHVSLRFLRAGWVVPVLRWPSKGGYRQIPVLPWWLETEARPGSHLGLLPPPPPRGALAGPGPGFLFVTKVCPMLRSSAFPVGSSGWSAHTSC